MSTEPTAEEEREIIVVADDCISPIERRSHERVTTNLRVRWEGLLGYHEGTVSDISPGGCFILADGDVALNELLRVEIEFHNGSWVKVWGEVTNRAEGIGFGVRYTEIDADGEDGKYALAIGQAKALKSAVVVLKRLDATVVRRDGNARACILANLAEYNSHLMLVLPKVNRVLVGLPECRKKSSVKLSARAYVDASRAWAVMSKGPRPGEKNFPEVLKLLKERYAAPPEILSALARREHLPVLNFLWLRGYVYLTFAH
jgi:PilZ domain